jgi:uncharacterized protein (DUF362 family)
MKRTRLEQQLLARRHFLLGGAVATAGLFAADLEAAQAAESNRWIAKPPPGFVPLSIPGKVVRVEKGGDFASMMQPNQLWPKAEVARATLERALTELTGAPNLTQALGKLIHKDDIVALKVNGIAGQKGGTAAFNFELVLPVVEGLIALGVKPSNITAFEQWPSFLLGTRVGAPGHELPKGVKISFHSNRDAVMSEVAVFQGIKTKFVRQLTDATAVIDMTMMKDHSICGFTGAMKNMTHGQIINPQDHHAYNCNPQIAMLYNHPVLRSRVRLHIVDAFKIIYDEGPLDRNPKRRIPHGSVYVATDAVALDTIGWKVIEDSRKANGLKSLKTVGREPGYIRTAAELGLGVHDLNDLRLRSVLI